MRPLELHIIPYENVVIASAGTSVWTSLGVTCYMQENMGTSFGRHIWTFSGRWQGMSFGVTQRTIWRRPQDIFRECPQDVVFRRPDDVVRILPLALHRGSHGDVQNMVKKQRCVIWLQTFSMYTRKQTIFIKALQKIFKQGLKLQTIS